MINITDIYTPELADICYKVIISIGLGFVIGLERELTNKSAGLRTHILVCLGSTIFTVLSIVGFNTYMVDPVGNRIPNDPARIAAQVVTGIGFIGGGAVIRNGTSIFGLTTAASLWITASIGMAVGAGNYKLAVITTFLAFVILVIVRVFERHVLSKYTKRGAKIKATLRCKSEFSNEIQSWFYTEFKNVIEMDIRQSRSDNTLNKLTFIVDVFEINPIRYVYNRIKNVEHIEQLSLQQVFEEQ